MNNKRDKPFKTDFTILFDKIKKKKKKSSHYNLSKTT